MHYVYVVNRFNLRERTDEVMQKLIRASEEAGRDYEILLNETPEEAGRAMEKFRDTAHVITAVGGDGTINRVLNDIAGTKNILSCIPCGTGNDFCRALAEKMEDGIHEADIVRINDRYFINAACFGIDADIANDDSYIHNRLIPRKLRFPVGAVAHFLAFRGGRKLRVELGDETVEKEFTTVIAANSRYYGGGFNVSPESRIDDGKMEVLLADGMPKLKMARTILSMKNAGHLHNPAVKIIGTDRLAITSPVPVIANIDGEPLAAERFDIELIPRGIRLEVNREFSARTGSV